MVAIKGILNSKSEETNLKELIAQEMQLKIINIERNMKKPNLKKQKMKKEKIKRLVKLVENINYQNQDNQ